MTKTETLDHSDIQVLRATYLRQGLHPTDPVFGILTRMDRVVAQPISKAAKAHLIGELDVALKTVHKIMEGKPKLKGTAAVHRGG